MGPGHGWPQWGKCRQISVPGEVVVLGEVQGNVDASERVNISSEGSEVNWTSAQRRASRTFRAAVFTRCSAWTVG